MLDPRVDPRRVLKRGEIALWSGRIEDSARKADREKSKRHTIAVIIVSVLVAAYFAYRIYSELTAHTLTGFDLWVSTLADLLGVLGALWLVKFCLKTLVQTEEATPTSIYILTDQRLLALDDRYSIRDALPLEDIDFVVTARQANDEFHIARKSDPHSEKLFYVHLVPGLNELEQQLDAIIEVRD